MYFGHALEFLKVDWPKTQLTATINLVILRIGDDTAENELTKGDRFRTKDKLLSGQFGITVSVGNAYASATRVHR